MADFKCAIDPECRDWRKHRPIMPDGYAYDPHLAAWDKRGGRMTDAECAAYVETGMRLIAEAHK